MKNTDIVDPVLFGLDNESVGLLADAIGKSVENSIDVSKDTERILLMTPKDGYQKKIELISEADDMSTQEKIKAIDEAEEKYAQGLDRNSELYSKIRWTKVGVFFTCTACLILMIASPEGKRIVKSVSKFVA